jgi:sucrose-6-phosphate hydrolase SacC (GH32 family)
MHLPPGQGVRPCAPYRPQLHYTPARNWMNDPNGLVWHDGEYHLFYQYNPYGNDWGNMSWGHAVSTDLVHWEELGVAIEATDDEHVFSGSAVIDHDGTMVAVYTGYYPASGLQAQSLARSTDRGRTWTRHPGNPVLDIGSKEFRDPKVFWYGPGGYWVMAVVLALEWKVSFYRSDDLLSWTWLSDFGPDGSVDGIWEVPDLFELDGRWVLVVSLNPGGPAGGSGVQYFVGRFDGVTFTSDWPASWADHGRDFYAVVSWNDTPDGRRRWIGWMSNWDDAAAHPTDPWRGAQSLPRELLLEDIGGRPCLVQRPVAALQALRSTDAVHLADLDVPPGVTFRPVPEGALEITAEFEPGTAERFGLVIHEGLRIGYDVVRGEAFVDGTPSGRHAAPLSVDGLRLTAIVDTSSVEVFFDRGQVVFTEQVFADPGSPRVGLFADNGTAQLRSATVHSLASIWDER